MEVENKQMRAAIEEVILQPKNRQYKLPASIVEASSVTRSRSD